MLKPEITTVIQIYLDLMSLIDKEELVNALEGIIQQFETEIIPFAVNLSETLAK